MISVIKPFYGNCFYQHNKENTMGNACGCSSALQIQSPRPLQPSHRTSQPTQLTTQRTARTQPKFTDIVPQQTQLMEPTQRNMNLLNQGLETILVQYEQLNGEISKRFTRRSLKQQSAPMVQFTSSESLGHHSRVALAESPAKKELQLPIDSQNIEITLEQVSLNSKDDTQKHSSTVTSCLLTQQSRLLNDSVFTDRLLLKNQFYNKYNRMGEVVLMEWRDSHRLSYRLYIDELLQLRECSTNQGLMVCLESLYQYWKQHEINLLCYSLQPFGLKVHVNGLKRCFPIDPATPSQPSLSVIDSQIVSKLEKNGIAEMIYILTGWIPECIDIAEIKNFGGIFERLSNNLREGNSLITFTRAIEHSQEYMCLERIDFQKELLYIGSAGTKTTIPSLLLQQPNDDSEVVITFQNFIEMFDVINLNWNPLIYQVSIRRQGLIKPAEKGTNKYKLIIPPCSQDIQIRLFLQKHHNFDAETRQSSIQISLFEAESIGEDSDQPIRQLQTRQLIFSDVFIFQSCKEKTQYVITVAADESSLADDIYYSLTMLSFVEIKFEQMKIKSLLKQTSIVADITPQHAGYGINSPFFNRNLQFVVNVQRQRELMITLSAVDTFSYQICLIPDPEQRQDLIKVSLENIINNSIISCEKKGVGSFCVNTEFTHYLLVINAYSQITDQIEIKLGLYGNLVQPLTQPILQIGPCRKVPNITFVQDVKWLPHHTGPRKRLKTNSVRTYQPLQTFSQFFKNPFIDRSISKGTYQFFVRSETFQNFFQSVEGYEDKNVCQPPALSMALFQSTEDNQQFRIILDDAFYVPFGMGFWSGEVELEEGVYRFVFPKIERDFSKGSFGIITC